MLNKTLHPWLDEEEDEAHRSSSWLNFLSASSVRYLSCSELWAHSGIQIPAGRHFMWTGGARNRPATLKMFLLLWINTSVVWKRNFTSAESFHVSYFYISATSHMFKLVASHSYHLNISKVCDRCDQAIRDIYSERQTQYFKPYLWCFPQPDQSSSTEELQHRNQTASKLQQKHISSIYSAYK